MKSVWRRCLAAAAARPSAGTGLGKTAGQRSSTPGLGRRPVADKRPCPGRDVMRHARSPVAGARLFHHHRGDEDAKNTADRPADPVAGRSCAGRGKGNLKPILNPPLFASGFFLSLGL